MLLTYVDESYCKQCYFVTALICPEREILSLSNALDDVMEKVCKEFPEIAPTAELHGRDILQGKHSWAPLHEKVRARIGVYSDAIESIASHDVSVIIRGVDSIKLKDRYRDRAFHPHSVALAQLLERVDAYAAANGELTIVIADEPGQADQQPEFREDLRKYQKSGTWGSYGRKLERIVDTLHFAPSKESRLLQAADLIAFLHHRIETTDLQSNPRSARASQEIWAHVQGRVHSATLWTP